MTHLSIVTRVGELSYTLEATDSYECLDTDTTGRSLRIEQSLPDGYSTTTIPLSEIIALQIRHRTFMRPKGMRERLPEAPSA